MKNDMPEIEFLPNWAADLPPGNAEPWFRSRRLLIFAGTCLLSATLGLIYNYSRPPIYQSKATLLTSAMTAIDKTSAAADIQHVAIQRQILLGQELLDKTLEQLKASGELDPKLQLTVEDIQQALRVDPVAETNLVEMIAEGTHAYTLPMLINTWIDVYTAARAEEVENTIGATRQIVETELQGLSNKIDVARLKLDEFRRNHDITSTGREENEAAARLNGLNKSLNQASEEEVKAKARLDAVRKAIERGQTVVPQESQNSLRHLEQRAQQLRERLAELDKRFTRDYLALQPSLKVIPGQLAKLEAEIQSKRNYGRDIVLDDAEQNYEAARQAVKEIRKQLDDHKKQAAEFTSRFAEHTALKTDLEGLEKLYRETQERLVQIETSHKEKYPQVHVIERAHLSLIPISPHYTRDAFIAVIGSVLFGIFSVWLFDYLTRKQQQQQQAGITLSGIHMYSNLNPDRPDMPHYPAPPLEQQESPIGQQETPQVLKRPELRELSDRDLQDLLNAANLKGKQLIALLLSGLTLDEAACLTPGRIDLSRQVIELDTGRTLPVNPYLMSLFKQSDHYPAWLTDQVPTPEDLAAILHYTVIDAGLSNPEEIDGDAIRHTYIVYLVRQGLRLSELEQVVGRLAPTVISSYGAYSPPRSGHGIDKIERLHPVLATDHEVFHHHPDAE